MRKILETIAVLALLATWGIALQAIFGPHPLPLSFPTHFDAVGHPNGWGGRGMVWLFPAIATAVYVGLSVLARFPGVFNYPVLVTPHNRARLESLTVGLFAWLKLELVCLFAWVEEAIVRSARQQQNALSPLFVPVVLVVVWSTVLWYIVTARRAGRRPAVSRPR